MPRVIETISQMRQVLQQMRREQCTQEPVVALVPTMGALHEGHMRLVEDARQKADLVVVSIFVNPLQFGPSEDLDKYPRSLERDMEMLGDLADIVFCPAVQQMYPNGVQSTTITNSQVARLWEGATRPGHFDGVLTVVAKLFSIVQPDIAVFGQKDAQQVCVIKQMVEDLNLPVTIVVHPIVRQNNGLALSSRNRYLTQEQADAACVLSHALQKADERKEHGVKAMISAARKQIGSQAQVRLDYLAVVDEHSFCEMKPHDHGPAIVIVAAWVGTTRLIDNMPITIPTL